MKMNGEMSCPVCRETMERGRVVVKSSAGSLLMFGMGGQDLYFEAEGGDGKKWKRVLASAEVKEGFRCGACKTLVIPRLEGGGWPAR